MEIYWKITLTLATVSIIMLLLPSFFNIIDDRLTREVNILTEQKPKNQWYLNLGGCMIVGFLFSLIISIILSIWS